MTVDHTMHPAAGQSSDATPPVYDVTPQKLRWIKAWIVFTVVFYGLSLGVGYFMAWEYDAGTGIGDGKVTNSCLTPGGPYIAPGHSAEECENHERP